MMTPRPLALWVAMALGLGGRAEAQDTQVPRLIAVHTALMRLGPTLGPQIWPGYRPDTLPVAYVIRGRGTLLLGWRGTPPAGFSPLPDIAAASWREAADQGAASTSVMLGGRSAAQVAVDSTATTAHLFATTFHEAFHVYERSMQTRERRFGQAENSFLVSRYPVFDALNDAAFALEGRLLHAALTTESPDSARALAVLWLAVRHERQRHLGLELSAFEMAAEMNEGLADYAAYHALRAAAADGNVPWHQAAGEEADRMIARVAHLTDDPGLSVRLRYYETGTAIAVLLDRIGPAHWQPQLVGMQNLELQDALGEAVDYFAAERALTAQAQERVDWNGLQAAAARAIGQLRVRRLAQVDSILAAPGILVEIRLDAIGGTVGLCGLDPQNLLQAGDGVLLHTRWVRPCAGPALDAEFNTPLVQDQRAGILKAVGGPATDLTLTVDGRPVALDNQLRLPAARNVHLEAPQISLRCESADLELNGRTLRIRPRQP